MHEFKIIKDYITTVNNSAKLENQLKEAYEEGYILVSTCIVPYGSAQISAYIVYTLHKSPSPT